MQKKNKLKIALVGLCLCSAVTAAPVSAAVITSKASVSTNAQLCGVGQAPNCYYNQLYSDSYRETKTSGDLSVSSYLSSGVTPSGSVTAYGAADMASGTLRVEASGLNIAAGTGTDQSAYAFAMSAVTLGDTFSIWNTDFTPYTGSGTSQFFLNIDGLLDGTADSNLLLKIQIGIFQPGYFDAIADGDYTTADTLRLASISTGWLYAGYTLPGGLLLDWGAIPGHSFEWEASILSYFSFRQAADEHIFANADLGHTATLNFLNPIDSLFTSASDLFPNALPSWLPGAARANAVPEPTTIALLGLGLAGLGLGRRRKTTNIIR